jgi:hypothetical protein
LKIEAESGTGDQGVRKCIKAKELDHFLNAGITARAKASVRRVQVGTPAIAIKLNLNPHSLITKIQRVHRP